MYGKIKAKLSYKVIVLVVLAMWVVGLTLISRALSIWIIGASVALVGMGIGIVFPAALVWIGETVSVSFRGCFALVNLWRSYAATLVIVGLPSPKVA